MDLKEKIRSLPSLPGVYFMKGEDGEVMYVGKAADLKKRVSSYFRKSADLNDRISAMAGKVKDITYLITSTEAEALIYENSLIKQLSPKYNVALRDGKSYPMLKLTMNEKFPRLFIARQKKDDGALYYGPYSSAKLLKQALIALRQIFPLRSCGKFPKRPCLNYHIKQCLGPCAGRIEDRRYMGIVGELKLFLEGKREELVKAMLERMADAARREDFEEAGRIKERVEGLSSMKERGIRYYPAGEIEELRNILKIGAPLKTIEAFDVSNIMGQSAVGSMISFYKGRPEKSQYRKFKIKTVAGIDDYAMMRELVRRRYSRLLNENKAMPDLVVIDGGRGHLGAAVDELKKLGLAGLPVIGIAKEFERIYTKDKAFPIELPKESKALHLLERIRDEAHRFAISYHRKLMSKRLKER